MDSKEKKLGEDVYGDKLNNWHNISFEGDEPMFAYSTDDWTVMYGLNYEGEKEYSASFSTSLYYMETSPDEIYYFDTLEESKSKADELLNDLKKNPKMKHGGTTDKYTNIIISSEAPLSSTLGALTGERWNSIDFEGDSDSFVQKSTGRKFKTYKIAEAKRNGITGVMIPSQNTVYEFWRIANQKGATNAAHHFLDRNFLTENVVDSLLGGYATGASYAEEHDLLVKNAKTLYRLHKMKKGGQAHPEKIEKVMHEFKEGKLKSHGKVVKKREQAVAIALNEANMSKYENGGDMYKENWGPAVQRVGNVFVVTNLDRDTVKEYRYSVQTSEGHVIKKFMDKDEAIRYADGLHLEHGGNLSEGNFYIILNDGNKKWYSESDPTKIRGVYFAMGIRDDSDTKAGDGFIHFENALNPLFDKNGKQINKSEYAGKDYYDLNKAECGGMYENGGNTSNIDMERIKEASNKIFSSGHALKLIDKVINDRYSLDKKEVLSLGAYLERLDQYATKKNDIILLMDTNSIALMLYEDPKFKKGGIMKNQYKDKTEEQVWTSWNEDQRLHFLLDHSDDIFEESLAQEKGFDNGDKRHAWKKLPYSELNQEVQLALMNHVEMGQYEEGGSMYAKGGGAGEWNDLSNINPKKIEVIEKTSFGNPDKLILKVDGKTIADFYYNMRGYNQNFFIKNAEGVQYEFGGDRPKSSQVANFKRAIGEGFVFVKSYDKNYECGGTMYANGGEITNEMKNIQAEIDKIEASINSPHTSEAIKSILRKPKHKLEVDLAKEKVKAREAERSEKKHAKDAKMAAQKAEEEMKEKAARLREEEAAKKRMPVKKYIKKKPIKKSVKKKAIKKTVKKEKVNPHRINIKKVKKKDLAAISKRLPKSVIKHNLGKKLNLGRDAGRHALPAGKRISKDGNVYYENRPDHSDVSVRHKLESGGSLYNQAATDINSKVYAAMLEKAQEEKDWAEKTNKNKKWKDMASKVSMDMLNKYLSKSTDELAMDDYKYLYMRARATGDSGRPIDPAAKNKWEALSGESLN